ncbi:pre-rRNA-processing protein pno1 [Oleoguttula sp. CCFEE 5521]
MPAPTALQRAPQALADEMTPDTAQPMADNDDMTITTSTTHTAIDAPETVPLPSPTADEAAMQIDSKSSLFAPEKASTRRLKVEDRKVRIPPHRLTPLKAAWPKIYPPLVEHLKLQVRMNVSKKTVELRTSSLTTDTGALQKGVDFITAFTLGFDPDDAIALLRLDDLYIETFEIKDVKTLGGEHMGRAVGRIAGKDGKTKYAIENASRTRVVLADTKVHILGGFQNIHVAREAISAWQGVRQSADCGGEDEGAILSEKDVHGKVWD